MSIAGAALPDRRSSVLGVCRRRSRSGLSEPTGAQEVLRPIGIGRALPSTNPCSSRPTPRRLGSGRQPSRRVLARLFPASVDVVDVRVQIEFEVVFAFSDAFGPERARSLSAHARSAITDRLSAQRLPGPSLSARSRSRRFRTREKNEHPEESRRAEGSRRARWC